MPSPLDNFKGRITTPPKGTRKNKEKYCKEIADIIIDMLLRGHTITDITSREDMPSPNALIKWRNKYPDFDYRFTQACEESIEVSLDHVDAVMEDVCMRPMDQEELARKRTYAEFKLRSIPLRRAHVRLRLDAAVKRNQQQPIEVTIVDTSAAAKDTTTP